VPAGGFQKLSVDVRHLPAPGPELRAVTVFAFFM